MNNIHYIIIIVIQNVILIIKISDKSDKKKQLIIIGPETEVIKICNITNIFLKYNSYLNPTTNKVTIDLRLQSIIKY